jgi:hypothetical protein
MRLHSIKYTENNNESNPDKYINEANPDKYISGFEELQLGKINILIGFGHYKKHIVKYIFDFARILDQQVLSDGEFEASLVNDHGSMSTYHLIINKGTVLKEEIFVDSEIKVIRNIDSTNIFSHKEQEWQEICVPENKLVLHCRRDKLEYFFFEDWIKWAESVGFYYDPPAHWSGIETMLSHGLLLINSYANCHEAKQCKRSAEVWFKNFYFPNEQIILTVDNGYFINEVPLEYLTIWHQPKNMRGSFINYINSREKFNNWRKLGLNNLEILESNFLSDNA